MTRAIEELVRVLDLESSGDGRFIGQNMLLHRPRIFGGQVAAQALVAADRTVHGGETNEADAGRPVVHSLHAYFLRAGDPHQPLNFEVDQVRDSRTFATRRVTVTQGDRAVFTMLASFHVPEEGFVHQAPMPEAPDPETLPTLGEEFARHGHDARAWGDDDPAVEQRPCDSSTWFDATPRPAEQLVWLRATGLLPDDPLLHVCVAVFGSDLMLLDTVRLPHGVSWGTGSIFGASLDHAMWFHTPFRADEWLLYAQSSSRAAGARGLAEGRMFTRDGRLVASVVQEGLLRPTATGSRGEPGPGMSAP